MHFLYVAKICYIYYNTLMIDFVCIFSIFLELILTCLVIYMLIILEKKIAQLNVSLLETGEMILLANQKIRNTISKINKIVSFATNKKVAQARKIFALTVDIIQIIIFIRSLDFSKGFKSINFSNIKKLLLAQTIRSFIKNILKNSTKLTNN